MALWSKVLMELGEQYVTAEQEAEKGNWTAVKIAQEMRAKFPRKGRHGGEGGWQEYCKKVLRREPGTIAERIRAGQYLDQHLPGWTPSDALPPWSLVEDLASRQDGPEKTALHGQLFSGQYAKNKDFRMALSALRELEESRSEAKSAPPAKRPKGDSDASPKASCILTSMDTSDLATIVGEKIPALEIPEGLNGLAEIGLAIGEGLASNWKRLGSNGGFFVRLPTKGGK